MTKRWTIGFLLVCLAVIGLACSQSEADAAKEDAGKTVSPEEMYYDSLAAMRADMRNEENKIVTLETTYGNLTLELFHDLAPAHADSFVARSVEGFYDSTIFHRIIKGFMIQGGDPTGTGRGNAGYNLPAEFSDVQHVEGTLSAARGGSPNSASCQFFVCLERSRSTAGLDGKYTVFGHLLKGYDALHRLGNAEVSPSPRGERSVPVVTATLIKAYLSDKDGKAL